MFYSQIKVLQVDLIWRGVIYEVDIVSFKTNGSVPGYDAVHLEKDVADNKESSDKSNNPSNHCFEFMVSVICKIDWNAKCILSFQEFSHFLSGCFLLLHLLKC